MMKKKPTLHTDLEIPFFDRNFFDPERRFSRIGNGWLGGKAQGLAFMTHILEEHFAPTEFPTIQVDVPNLTVITTDMFDDFMEQNNLYEIAYSDMRDDQIAHAFQKGDLPARLVGDLRALVNIAHVPLAIRSSSLLEDTMYEPFAGVYATKMTPNYRHDPSVRFQRLAEAIKFVYASTFFREAKNYLKATGHRFEDEKMAVIIQEVVGTRYGNRFYPVISGVARSYNFYPMGRAKPEQGVVDLALGLGKTIVDGGLSWAYSPAYPKISPPYGSISELMKMTQTEFWAVNMERPPVHDPTTETEYLLKFSLADADYDNTLRHVASTYNVQSNRITMGVGIPGPRIVNFAPILVMNEIPLNKLIKRLLQLCEEKIGTEVEIEFAVVPGGKNSQPARLGFLQVRPMVVSDQEITVEENELKSPDTLIASESVLGNGTSTDLTHVVFVKPDVFESKYTRIIAQQIEEMNRQLVAQNQKYLLIGFGRWGSSDQWLGIPVNWSQISGAQVIVEATLPSMNVDLSQGSHFFHNLTSLQIYYLSVSFNSAYPIDWEWLAHQQTVSETDFVKHVQLSSPLTVKIDGRHRKGVVLK